MRVVVQRVSRAQVSVTGELVGSIGKGYLLLLGVAADDSLVDAEQLVNKVLNLRIMDDAEGKMNLSLLDCSGDLLVVSQFTLFADTRRGRRPSYIQAAPPDMANELYEHFVSLARQSVTRVETGRFQAMMDVELVNDGPVTLILDSKKQI
jgi:D-aminoacyl-tRNA deacylase